MNIKTVACGIATVLFCALPSLAQTKSSPSDQTFVRTAAEIDMTQAHLGQMAQQQASKQGVKDFAQTLANDHSTSYGQLLAVAQRTDVQVPRGIDIGKDTEFRQLEHAKGADFDRKFLGDEIRDHQKALTEFKHEAEHGENPELKNYASQQLPVLEQHLHKAEDLAKAKQM